MIEIWKKIDGYAGIYEVSNLGNVRNVKTGKTILSKHNNRGYVQVSLSRNKKADYWLLHRLVAVTFIENPDNLPQVNHKDENKDNNCAENLEWCTNLYNRRYGTGYSRSVLKHDYNRLAEKNRKTVNQFDLQGNLLGTWKGLKAAELATGVEESNIRRCCYGRGRSAGGYVWQYACDIQ